MKNQVLEDLEDIEDAVRRNDESGLVSEESGERVCYIYKNTMDPGKLSLRKYSLGPGKHVLFVETKKRLG